MTSTANHTHYASSFGIIPDTGSNCTASAQTLIGRMHDGATVIFDPGVYHFYPDQACEMECRISNNSAGLKRVALPLRALNGITIEATGAEFVFHGAISPFAIENCSDITIKGLTIDWSQPVTLCGQAVAVNGREVEIKLHPDIGYRIDNGCITTVGENWQANITGFIEIDDFTKAPAYGTGDVWGCKGTEWYSTFREIEPGIIGFTVPAGRDITQGNHIVFLRGDRLNPAIFATSSRNILLQGVTVYQAPAMAFIAQRSENIALERFRVQTRPGLGRIVSASADATHFVNCKGQIKMTDCLFESQLDDPTNIHGIYTRVVRRNSDREFVLERAHFEQAGAPALGDGDRVAIKDGTLLETVAEAIVTSIVDDNYSEMTVVFDAPIPDAVEPGMVVENLTWNADVEIINCTAGKNRARGFLISTPGKVLIDGCTLCPGGTGILIAGESQQWFESGAVRDVTIRGNKFINCNSGTWGRSSIDITPAVPKLAERKDPFHRNISIIGNIFETHQAGVITAWSVENLTIRHNRIQSTDPQAPCTSQSAIIELRCCKNITVRDNAVGLKIKTPFVDADPESRASLNTSVATLKRLGKPKSVAPLRRSRSNRAFTVVPAK